MQGNLPIMTDRHDKAVGNVIGLHSRCSLLTSAQEDAESKITRLEAEVSKREAQFQVARLQPEPSKVTPEHENVVGNIKQLNNFIVIQKKKDDVQNKADGLQRALSKTMIGQGKVVDEVKQLKAANTAL